MARYGDLYVNNVTGERAVVLRGDEDAPDEPLLAHLYVLPGGAVAGEHLHPALHERFQVLAGELETKIDGTHRTLRAGEDATVPAGVWHDWWNASDRPVDVLVELTRRRRGSSWRSPPASAWPTPVARTPRASRRCCRRR